MILHYMKDEDAVALCGARSSVNESITMVRKREWVNCRECLREMNK